MLKRSFSLYFIEDNNVVHAGAGWGHALSSTIPVELEAGMCSQANSEPAGKAIFILQTHLHEKHHQITREKFTAQRMEPKIQNWTAQDSLLNEKRAVLTVLGL